MPFAGNIKRVGLITGVLVFASMLLLPSPENLSEAGWHTAALALLMAVWWITEALPIAATALLPGVLMPVLGIANIEEALAPYAHPLIFLFMGGFIIAVAMQKWDLHRRIALNIVAFVGTRPRSIVLGFILASAFLSMWVSNTATALMMLPIALSVLHLVTKEAQSEARNFGLCLLLGVAYGCNIGGMGTLIGTPPNAFLAAFMEDQYGIEISFVTWMLFAVPLVAIALPVLYVVLTRHVYPISMKNLPGGKALINKQLTGLGRISSAEKKVAAVFGITAILWISRPMLQAVVPGLSDTGIAMAAALSFFLIPVESEKHNFILNWEDAESVPWGVLILFGGGLSLASGISTTGLAAWIAEGVQVLAGWPVVVVLLTVVAVIVLLTEITSNTATAAAFLPIMGSVALGLGQAPLLFAVPVALSASCAFMLPVATPPNAIVYGSNHISISEMVRAGVWLNIIFIGLISIWTYTLAPVVFGF
jgi:sodium-dependent dicarboxylate transporter 2/3/5